MKINFNNNQSFGASVDKNTKYLMYQLEKKSIDTKPISDVINRIYVGKQITTRISDSGNIQMDIYSKDGDFETSVLKRNDKYLVDAGTYALKNPKSFATKLYKSLLYVELNRSQNQKIWDKINGQFRED